jgi:hypothetical protein
MGGAIAADGSMAMQCQSCHGSMSTVGSANRVGWFMEPNCGSCHSGTATSNNGQIRYASVFTDTNGTVRAPVNPTFASPANVPANGLSLFRFSAGHGGLQCSACHGSTHAEFPSTHANDNVRNQKIQGHAGVMTECTACHVTMAVNSSTATNGPHGMHPLGQSWVSGHHDFIGNLTQCQACHGNDSRGTVLSRVQGNRTLTASFDTGTVTLNIFRGALIGCYTCHNGPDNDSVNNSVSPTVNVVAGTIANNAPLQLPVTVTPASATLRIISQPSNGSLGASNNVLTYFPEAGFVGNDTFTYAAWDGAKNSLLTTGNVSVVQGPYSLGLTAQVPTNAPAGWPVSLSAFAAPVNTVAPVSFQWNFGDGSAVATNPFVQHSFAAPGIYSWQVVAAVATARATNAGSLVVTAPMVLAMASVQASALSLSWPASMPNVVVEQSASLTATAAWTVVTNLPVVGPNNATVSLPVAEGNRFYRARQPW